MGIVSIPTTLLRHEKETRRTFMKCKTCLRDSLDDHMSNLMSPEIRHRSTGKRREGDRMTIEDRPTRLWASSAIATDLPTSGDTRK